MVIVPLMTGTSPARVCSRVVLPAPLRPRRATISPRFRVQIDARNHRHPGVAHHQVLGAEQHFVGLPVTGLLDGLAVRFHGHDVCPPPDTVSGLTGTAASSTPVSLKTSVSATCEPR